MTTEDQITKLEKEIEKKTHIKAKPVQKQQDFRINLERVKVLAKKIREFESQSDAPAVG